MLSNVERFKTKLEEEKTSLEKDLASYGRLNPNQEGDWEVKPMEETPEVEFNDEVADHIGLLEGREATEITLEERLRDVNEALAKISAGTYGDCKVCGAPIEEDRLEANPAAQTCKTHRDE